MAPAPRRPAGCPSCGQSLSATPELYGTTIECPACQKTLTVPHPQPVPPQLPLAASTPVPAIWNPSVCGVFSLLFGLAIGPWLHSLNWKALGRTDEASKARFWALGLLGVDILRTGYVLTQPKAGTGLGISFVIGLAALLVWIVAAGRKQEREIKGRVPGTFRKRSWMGPIFGSLGYACVWFLACSVTSTSLQRL
ncbi:hypothetical protein KBB96_09885 [Luteolibacter ambystomatis]|uniref:Uncharacterized protein n=1 Tax=Luteolibacter ambystomatis TaxID=2824561 RepID=A0A975J397_9BACT|nr:hypothetical protein [Luteolibacter ambystomatis]QUE53191.1 hypothetical protein KBB96_09885 [Luteolibacter ambystomatis]